MNNDGIFLREESFHDNWATSTPLADVKVEEFFEVSTVPENRYMIVEMGDLKGKKILDLGTGLGEAAVYFALQGAEVVATDISGKMLELAKELAKSKGTNIKTVKATSDKINLPDKSFDIIYTANLLHHVEIEPTIKEAKRLLKDNGRFFSWDPLAYNPLINIYRKKAMQVRTLDEHPLTINDVKLIKSHFKNTKIKTFWQTTLAIFLKYYLIDRIDPNKERYWKRIISNEKEIRGLYKFLERIDKLIFKIFPFTKWYSWSIVIIGEK